MELTYKQTEALDFLEDNITNELLFGGGAGGGKSALGCYWQIKTRLKYPNTRGLIGRSKLKTLKETTLKTFFEVAKMQGLKKDVHYTYNSTASLISFTNGSEILLKDLFFYPSDPNFDELGSLEITDAFIDESNQITKKAKSIIKSRIRFQLDENGLIPKIMMSCNPAKNWVFSDFYKPYKDGSLDKNKAFVHSLVTDNPFISQHYIDNLQDLDEQSKKRLLDGNWDYDDSPDRMINFDSILNMWIKEPVEDNSDRNYITIDVARLGKDKTVIMRWSGYNVVEIEEIAKSGLDKIKEVGTVIAAKAMIPNRNILIDEDGVGGGLVDFWKGTKGFTNNARALKGENYSNLKTQCAYRLAKVINNNNMTICQTPAKELIIQELEQIKTYKMDSDTKLQILPKDKVKEIIGRSPDYSDALLMRMYFDVSKGNANYSIR